MRGKRNNFICTHRLFFHTFSNKLFVLINLAILFRWVSNRLKLPCKSVSKIVAIFRTNNTIFLFGLTVVIILKLYLKWPFNKVNSEYREYEKQAKKKSTAMDRENYSA